ncbi:type II 3-dehydroquinate dehydratase [Bacillaceae bacterium W0354]
MGKVLLLNGPNLNLLDQRRSDHYGQVSLEEIENELKEYLNQYNIELTSFQSNHEGELIDRLHEANNECVGVIFNPGAYTHTSVALHDAIEAIRIPVVEVHISNIHNRESFRSHSFIAPVSIGQVSGFGPLSYLTAAFGLVQYLERKGEK